MITLTISSGVFFIVAASCALLPSELLVAYRWLKTDAYGIAMTSARAAYGKPYPFSGTTSTWV